MTGLKIQNVRKSYGSVEVLHGVSVDVKDKDLAVIVGSSGCGKSTLLRAIAGLEEVNEGKILIGKNDITHLEPKDRNIAMVFQNYALYPHMTVFENMSYGLKNKKVPKEEIKDRVHKASEILQLTQFLNRRPRQLSGGQRQRVAMGRAIVRKPSIFLFDEPLSNLDAKLRMQMRVEIKQLQKMLGITSVYVTHDQVEAMTLADQLIVLNKGNVEQVGSPLDIYENPKTKFVAGFIGSPSMNFIEGKIGSDHKSISVANDTTFKITRTDLDENQPITVGVRPEHLSLGDHEKIKFKLKAELVEPLGADTLIHGRLENFVDDIIIRVNGQERIAVNDIIPVCLSEKDLYLFDTKTGLKI